MSGRKLTILGIVAVFMVIWAVVQSHISNRPGTESDTLMYLIQGLDPADIGSIVLRADENEVKLKRQGRRFVVANRDNYPAVSNKINELITSCLDIRTVELYTDDKANHKDLGVTEEDAQNVVKFLKPDSSLLAGVVIGKAKEQGQGSFVRLASSDKVYVTLERPWIKSGAIDYIEQELISADSRDIESVTISSPDEVYTLKSSEEDESIILENLPEGKKLKGDDYKRVFTALTNFRFEDIKKKSAAERDLTFDRQFICRLRDSTVYAIRIAQDDDNKTYITCKAEFTDKTPVVKGKGVESEEELRKKEAKLLAREKAGEFSEKHRGWVYEIAEYEAENLTKELSELLEDVQKPEQPEQVGEPNSVQ